MGTQLNDIVQVNITRETAKITQAGFGTALIFGPLTEFTDRLPDLQLHRGRGGRL